MALLSWCWTTVVLQPCRPELMLALGRFISNSTNAGTAANYVGCVKWACVNFNLSCAGWTELVTLTLKGLKAEHPRFYGRPASANMLITDDWVAQVACLADRRGLMHVQAASLVSSVFLMRVQSETLTLVRGAPAERYRPQESPT